MRSFMKIKHSRNGKTTQSFKYISKSCPSREFFASQICILMQFAKIPDLQYSDCIPMALTVRCQLSGIHCVG